MKRLKQIALVFSILAGGVAMTGFAGALNFSTDTTGDDALDLQFTYAPVLTVTTGSPTISIEGLQPGSVDFASTTVTVSTNNYLGYILSASVGCATGTNCYNSTDLSDGTNTFTMAGDGDALSAGKWGVFLNSNPTSSTATKALAIHSGDATVLNHTTDAAGTKYSDDYLGGSTIPFSIGAYATTSQAAGTYTNVINFYAVAN